MVAILKLMVDRLEKKIASLRDKVAKELPTEELVASATASANVLVVSSEHVQSLVWRHESAVPRVAAAALIGAGLAALGFAGIVGPEAMMAGVVAGAFTVGTALKDLAKSQRPRTEDLTRLEAILKDADANLSHMLDDEKRVTQPQFCGLTMESLVRKRRSEGLVEGSEEDSHCFFPMQQCLVLSISAIDRTETEGRIQSPMETAQQIIKTFADTVGTGELLGLFSSSEDDTSDTKRALTNIRCGDWTWVRLFRDVCTSFGNSIEGHVLRLWNKRRSIDCLERATEAWQSRGLPDNVLDSYENWVQWLAGTLVVGFEADGDMLKAETRVKDFFEGLSPRINFKSHPQQHMVSVWDTIFKDYPSLLSVPDAHRFHLACRIKIALICEHLRTALGSTTLVALEGTQRAGKSTFANHYLGGSGAGAARVRCGRDSRDRTLLPRLYQDPRKPHVMILDTVGRDDSVNPINKLCAILVKICYCRIIFVTERGDHNERIGLLSETREAGAADRRPILTSINRADLIVAESFRDFMEEIGSDDIWKRIEEFIEGIPLQESF